MEDAEAVRFDREGGAGGGLVAKSFNWLYRGLFIFLLQWITCGGVLKRSDFFVEFVCGCRNAGGKKKALERKEEKKNLNSSIS